MSSMRPLPMPIDTFGDAPLTVVHRFDAGALRRAQVCGPPDAQPASRRVLARHKSARRRNGYPVSGAKAAGRA